MKLSTDQKATLLRTSLLCSTQFSIWCWETKTLKPKAATAKQDFSEIPPLHHAPYFDTRVMQRPCWWKKVKKTIWKSCEIECGKNHKWHFTGKIRGWTLKANDWVIARGKGLRFWSQVEFDGNSQVKLLEFHAKSIKTWVVLLIIVTNTPSAR